jgi:transketolase
VSAPTPTSYRIGNEDLPVFDNRVAFAQTLIELAKTDDRIVAVCNDSVGSSNLGGFREQFPDRLINVGIAEQNMVGVGAGLANAGMIPFVCAAGPFLSGRATEQIKADVAYSNLPVILCAMSPGMAYGELGPTHHSVEDFSWMRALPNLDILSPADEPQLKAAIHWAVSAKRPTYMRVGRHKVPNLTQDTFEFERGKSIELRSGADATVVATGSMVSRAVAAAEELAKSGIGVQVLSLPFIAPLDVAEIQKSAANSALIVTVEEANVAGGLGAAVASVVAALPSSRAQVIQLGTNDWSPTLSTERLFDHFGLTAENIAVQIKGALRK